jgi:hypothetical protein
MLYEDDGWDEDDGCNESNYDGDIYIYICIYVYLFICIYIYIYTFVYLYVYIYSIRYLICPEIAAALNTDKSLLRKGSFSAMDSPNLIHCKVPSVFSA